jgi:hypothetical protein
VAAPDLRLDLAGGAGSPSSRPWETMSARGRGNRRNSESGLPTKPAGEGAEGWIWVPPIIGAQVGGLLELVFSLRTPTF